MKQRGFVLPSPSIVMAAFIVALSISNIVFIKLYANEVSDYAEYRTNVETQMELLRIERDKKQSEAKRTIADVSRSWASALDHVRRNANRVVRVQQPKCDSGSGTEAPRPVEGTDATASTGLPSTTVDASRCEELINLGVRDAAQVLHLQADRNALCATYGCE